MSYAVIVVRVTWNGSQSGMLHSTRPGLDSVSSWIHSHVALETRRESASNLYMGGTRSELGMTVQMSNAASIEVCAVIFQRSTLTRSMRCRTSAVSFVCRGSIASHTSVLSVSAGADANTVSRPHERPKIFDSALRRRWPSTGTHATHSSSIAITTSRQRMANECAPIPARRPPSFGGGYRAADQSRPPDAYVLPVYLFPRSSKHYVLTTQKKRGIY